MKVVIDAREWSTSTGRYISSLVYQLEQIDSQYDYTILLYPKDMERYEPSNPCFTKVPCPYKEFTFAEQFGFKKQLNALAADLVHFGAVQQPVLYRGPVVTTMHDLTTVRFKNPSKNPLVFTLKQQVYKWVNKKVAHKSVVIITPTQFVEEDIVAFTGILPDKITVTHEAADAITDAPEVVAGLENSQFIMYVGRPTPHKNLERLIDAFADLQKTYPDLNLVLAGRTDANYRRVEHSVAQRGIKNIVFTDFVSDGQLRWLYEHTAAYVFPSLSEGFGLPGLEAMIHGAPVVSSNATCLPEVYGEAAHYFNPLDTTDMATKIGEVLNNQALRDELIAKGRQQAAAYSWRRMAVQTLDVYQKVLGSTDS